MTAGGPKHPPLCEFDIDKLALRLDSTVAADVKEVPAIVARILDFISDMGCSAEHEFEIRLALSEALINAVEHGCGHDPSKCVQVCVECDPARGMLIVVRDPGPGFDPSQVPSPVEGQQIFKDRGRGIFLINQLMDEVHFARGGAEIRMRMRRARPKDRKVKPAAEGQPPPE
jgi:serine/threonine-protein kinase RsbW